MTPQGSFMVVAPIISGREGGLRALLASMNQRPGVVDPRNAVLPFEQFGRLHFARFVILDDATSEDIKAHGIAPPRFSRLLAFLGDYDDLGDDFLEDLVQRAGSGLRKIFAHCQGVGPQDDLLWWLKKHSVRPAAMYVNWRGRTMEQIREEHALRAALVHYVDKHRGELTGLSPGETWERLVAFVKREMAAARLRLTPPAPTPLVWRIRHVLHLIGGAIFLAALAPLLLLYAPIFAWQLRRREMRDPEITPRPDLEHVRGLADIEDHDVTNQFSALGGVKPGCFRRWTVTFLVWVLDYGARHIYHRGYLTRVNTIHFARWVFLDDKQRLFFASNYDGSLESYMDDFINKVAWGLNLVFSNGVGYPRTRWLVLDGAKNEQKFKYYIRRHELPTEVWYNGHPGLTAFELDRNHRIRQGIEKSGMNEEDLRAWLKLI